MKETEQDIFSLTRQWSAIICPLLLVSSAWSIILIASTQHQIAWLNHDFLLQRSHLPWLLTLIIFLACWQVMILAMMLPAVVPLLLLIEDNSLVRAQHWRQQMAFVLGYALVWTIFALAAFVGDTGIHWLVAHWWWLYMHPWIIGTALLGGAGLFQLSSFKQQCLQHCCFPFDRYLSPDVQGNVTYRNGIHYGIYCLGSCWALMLVLFGLGMSSFIWMALGAGIMMGEKSLVGRYRFSQVIGYTFLLFALLWAVLPLGLLSNL